MSLPQFMKIIQNVFGHSAQIVLACLLIAMPPVLKADDPEEGEKSTTAQMFEPKISEDENAIIQNSLKLYEDEPAQAIDTLREYVQPDSSAALDFCLGNLYFQSENYGGAIKAYRAALNKMPAFRRAAANLGRVYLLQEEYEKVVSCYQKLVANGQADSDILLLLAHALLNIDKPVSAEMAYRQALLLEVDHFRAKRGLAQTLFIQQRYNETLGLTKELLLERPLSQQLWGFRANAQLSLEDYEAAARTIEQADGLDCAGAEMLATLGDIYVNREQPEDALSAYQRAFAESKPDTERVLQALEACITLGNEQVTARMLARTEELLAQESVELTPQAQVRILRAKAYLARYRGQTKQAIDFCKEILRLDPLDGKTMLLLARLQHSEGLLAQAINTCEHAKRLKDHKVDALIRHAQIEVERENYRDAIKLLEAAQKIDKRSYITDYLEQLRNYFL